MMHSALAHAVSSTRKVSCKAFVCFAISLILSGIVCGMAIQHKMQAQKLLITHLMAEKSRKIDQAVSRLLSKTQVLSALVVQGGGAIRDFDHIAATIVDDPAIMNVLLAPDGIVSHVYPLAGNEAVLGFNMFAKSAGNQEAIAAREKDHIVFSGPFMSVQGKTALAGRLPVYIPDHEHGRRFWGMVSVTLFYPQALESADLDSLRREGFAFELWRINPDSDQRQIIASSDYPYQSKQYVEQHFRILNADWYLRILSVRPWYAFPEHIALIVLALCFSLLLAVVVDKNGRLSALTNTLENLLLTDALTGVTNRTGILRTMEQLIKARAPFRLHYFDMNYFKQINDTHGHTVGDAVLLHFAGCFQAHVSPNHAFARMGGDEFVLVHILGDDASSEGMTFWKAVRREFEKPLCIGETSLYLSFSAGMAAYPKDGTTVDMLITHADSRMYENKRAKYAKENRRRASDWDRAHNAPIVASQASTVPSGEACHSS